MRWSWYRWLGFVLGGALALVIIWHYPWIVIVAGLLFLFIYPGVMLGRML
jgi:hypothetical protein